MSRDQSNDLAAIVAGLFSEPNIELLRQIDIESRNLGTFVKQYSSPPPAADLSSRSSIREDTVISEISRLLLSHAGVINVLDACCGLGTLPKRIIQSLGDKANRVSFWAVDQDPTCISLIRGQQREFAEFQNFQIMQRHVSDLDGLTIGSMDLIVLNNALHEIPPRHYPSMFATFNKLLNSDHGFVCVIDMETLPTDSAESIAISWSGAEVEQFLRAGGLSPVVTRHPKMTMVYQVHTRHTPNSVDETAMRQQIVASIKTRMKEAIVARQKIQLMSNSNISSFREWIVLTGTIARCAEELHAMNP
jgi:ubiquinone/menaquinone biosynthesis C-methylase UbiE